MTSRSRDQRTRSPNTSLLRLLADSPSTVSNCPAVGDVDITVQMLEALGCDVERTNGDTIVDSRTLTSSRVPLTFSGMNRIPILMVGPLLHRVGEAFVPLVGGDDIGARPLDFHVDALRKMGAELEITSEGLEAKASRLRGAHIELPYPSVGATETVLMTAAMAEGRTVLDGGALEPEVIELALFLQRMGAHIEMRPNRRYVIDGVERLSGASLRLQGDRIEAFSYLVAGLITGGQVTVHGLSQDRLVTAISTLSRMGAMFEITDTSVSARAEHLKAAAVETDTHPGFMTDWQSPMVALFTQCEGLSVMYETVYENRFTYVPALNKMGAQIQPYNTPLGSIEGRFVGSSTPCSVSRPRQDPASGRRRGGSRYPRWLRLRVGGCGRQWPNHHHQHASPRSWLQHADRQLQEPRAQHRAGHGPKAGRHAVDRVMPTVS